MISGIRGIRSTTTLFQGIRFEVFVTNLSTWINGDDFGVTKIVATLGIQIYIVLVVCITALRPNRHTCTCKSCGFSLKDDGGKSYGFAKDREMLPLAGRPGS